MPASSSRNATLRAAADPAIRHVVEGFAAITLGEWLIGTVVAIRALDLGGVVAVGLVGFRFAPAALAGLFTSLLPDRYDGRRILTVTALLRALAALCVAGGLAADLPVPVILIGVWLDAAAGSAYRPAQASLLPGIVQSPSDLAVATSLVSNAKSSGQLLGALLGGVLLLVFSGPVTVLVAVAFYLSAAILTSRLPASPRRTGKGADAGRGLRRFAAGAVMLTREHVGARIAAWSCARSAVRGIWVSLGVVASLTLLHAGRAGFGYLMAAAGLGALAGLFMTAAFIGRARLAGPFAAGLILCAAPVAGIGLSSSTALALALMFGWGIGMSISDVGAQALLNRVVAHDALPRIVGAIESAKLLSEGLGSLAAPALVAGLGIRDALIVAGAALPAMTILDYAAGGFRRIDAAATVRVSVLELIRGVPLCAPLRLDGVEAIAASLQPVSVPAGTVVMRQDDAGGSSWYLVETGELRLDVDGYDVGMARRGDSFGERSLLRSEPPATSVTAVTDAELLSLERTDFLRAVVGADVAVDAAPVLLTPRDALDALRRQGVFSGVDERDLAALAREAQSQSLDVGEVLFRQGDEDDRYFVVLKGELSVVIDGAERRRLRDGDGVGEIGVLHHEPRTATVAAVSETTVLAFSGASMRDLCEHPQALRAAAAD